MLSVFNNVYLYESRALTAFGRLGSGAISSIGASLVINLVFGERILL